MSTVLLVVAAVFAYQVIGFVITPKKMKPDYIAYLALAWFWPPLEVFSWVLRLFDHLHLEVKLRGALTEEMRQKIGDRRSRLSLGELWCEQTFLGVFYAGHWWRTQRDEPVVGRWWGITLPGLLKDEDEYRGIMVLRTVR